jgi:hypothetical protein
LCSAVLALDPMQRGLGPQERYQRSFKMLELVTGAIGRCGGVVPDDAERAMKIRVSAAHMSEAMETNLSMAEDLWKVRQKECSQTRDEEDEPLRLVLAKIAQ